jgi:peptide/nickel transport system substrate-binding protein
MRLRRRLAPFVVVAALFQAALGLAGCGQAGDQANAAADQRVNDWTVPGVLRIESAGPPDNLNPLIGQESIDTDLSMFWGGHLFDWDDRGEFVPDLATEVPTLENRGISRDGLTIEYHLRRGVTWQDGAPFTADDVVFTWRAVMNPRNQVAVRSGYDLISRIDVIDPLTIAVHLKHPYAPFVATFFAMSATSYGVLPKHLLAKYSDLNDIPFDRLPVGTGPFKVVFDDGKRVRMVAYPGYWRGAPGLREVEFRWESNSAAILDHLKNHSIDFYYGAYARQEPQLSGIPGTTIYLYPFNGYEDVGFNLASPLVSDMRVRQALAYATDRRKIVDTIANGVNSPADSDQPTFSWAYNPDVKQYHYDPRTARELLDAAGWIPGPDGIRAKQGRTLRIILVSGAGAIPPGPIESLIRNDWHDIGVDVAVRNYSAEDLDATAAQGGIEATGRFDAVLEGWVNGIDPDDSTQFKCAAVPPAGWNAYRFCDPALDSAEEQALTSNDRATRKRAYDAIQSILADDEPMIMLYFQQQQDVVNIDLKNYRPASAATPFWNTWQLEI